jgi:putative PIG3 family NAD(P)H quinone oxidoreductase
MAATMRAIGCEPGEALFIQTLPVPEPGAGEILIRVAAAGLNRADLVQREGRYPPPPGASPIMGLEVSGTVAALGPGVTRWKVGDSVCALLAGGGYAEYVAAPEGSALPIPAGLSVEEAGATPEAVFTVWANVFEACALKPGEAFLVHGGASGIGTTAIQMACAHAAKPFATAGDAEKCALVTRLGAKAINYKTEDFEAVVRDAGGVDVILDMVGGGYVQKNLRVLKAQGRLVNIAFLQGSKVEVDLILVMLKRLTITGSTLRARPIAEKARLAKAVEAQVWPWIAAGKVKPVIDSVFPLDQAEAAHARLAAGAHAGKIVLKV